MALTLSASNITRRYNGKPALDGCSFTFDAAGVYVIMGPNGSGKSTFLRICALIERPDEGRVEYASAGITLGNDLDLRRRTAMVLPGVGVFNTTVFKNAAYGLTVRGLKNDAAVERALAAVGLSHKLRHHALTLSSGETQRLGIARALVLDPEVFFLDEPTASIDQENTEIVESIIEKMKKEPRTTVIMTTHDRDQAERLADRVLVMRDGKILS